MTTRVRFSSVIMRKKKTLLRERRLRCNRLCTSPEARNLRSSPFVKVTRSGCTSWSSIPRGIESICATTPSRAEDTQKAPYAPPNGWRRKRDSTSSATSGENFKNICAIKIVVVVGSLQVLGRRSDVEEPTYDARVAHGRRCAP